MQAGIFKVFLVVITGIVNHPLLFPKNNATLPATDEHLLQKMKEHEENIKSQQLQLELLMNSEESQEEEPKTDIEAWDFWSALSMAIFLLIEIWRQDFQGGNTQDHGKEEDELQCLGNAWQGVSLPNKTMLAIFYDQYIRGAIYDTTKTREFVEGFADDLLEALRSVCNRDTDMEVEDSVCVGSTYENWRVNKPLVCDLIVPFAPPEPYHFKCQPWVTEQSIYPGYGTIRVYGPDDEAAGCVCGKTKLGEDMLCLLHSQDFHVKKNDGDMDLLCSKNSNFLSTDRVMKWFQTSVTKAWSKISHKYEFDLTFSHLNSPGALRVKFKSGKVISFNITPVVQYEDSDLYFISHFPNSTELYTEASNIHWILSFAVYERRFLKEIAKYLPANSCHLSCLQIMTFLYSKQCHLTGPSGLTTYHLKTVLLHLLLSRPSSDWNIVMLEERLRDMFVSLEKSLLEKKLNHFMVGNTKLPHFVNLPEIFHYTEPLNLFRTFVLNRDLYQKTLAMFYEMLKNASVLINEYSMQIPAANGNKSSH
ncbi:Hypothetical predicted protein [Pelobates cultripes]|uniref:Inositol 1,4,5-trisphosphate receptor-interacting protein n=1 Tax=Pelobates cultripes TaxID=61616 RepID=A0AAD1WV03_PELCU|nr:Hypothetical predicted protein [Pelobates cultripes]